MGIWSPGLGDHSHLMCWKHLVISHGMKQDGGAGGAGAPGGTDGRTIRAKKDHNQLFPVIQNSCTHNSFSEQSRNCAALYRGSTWVWYFKRCPINCLGQEHCHIMSNIIIIQ